MITHHCDDCGNEVSEFCQEHPKARVSSIRSGNGRARGNEKILICEAHLGDEATRADVDRMIVALEARGWCVGYGEQLRWPLTDGERAEIRADWNNILADWPCGGAP